MKTRKGHFSVRRDGWLLEMSGRQFMVRFERDIDACRPWEDCEGHGIIREGYESNKKPGWRKLAPTGTRDVWMFYDVKESTKVARRDGWDAEPYGQGTKGERAARAVESDFQFLRAWCNDEWEYVGVTVTLINSDESETAYSDSLWGVESFKDYHYECAEDMAESLIVEEKRQRMRRAKEKRERNYWAARDVATV